MGYPIHTLDSAPPESKRALSDAQQEYGFVPNLLATMAEAPALLKGYAALSRLFDESSLDAAERQVVLVAASHWNDCSYTIAAHRWLASKQHVSRDLIDAIRKGVPLANARLEALRRFATAVVRTRGSPEKMEMHAFLEAGFTPQQLLEVVLGVGLETLANYTHHIARTPIDAAFAKATATREA